MLYEAAITIGEQLLLSPGKPLLTFSDSPLEVTIEAAKPVARSDEGAGSVLQQNWRRSVNMFESATHA
jgi:hypothetical protein